MISRRFFIGAVAAVPAAAALAPLPSAAAGIGEKPGDLAMGDADAPVTLIEYFSLTCPALPAWFHQEHLRPAQARSMWMPARCASWRATSRSMRPRFRRLSLRTAPVGTAISPSSTSCSQTFDDWASFTRLHGEACADRRAGRREPGPLRGLPRGQGPRKRDFPVDERIGPGRIRREQHADGRSSMARNTRAR